MRPCAPSKCRVSVSPSPMELQQSNPTAAAAKSLQSCPTLCHHIDGSPCGCPVPGILQARTLEWVAISFSNAWKWKVKVKVKSCQTLSYPMDCGPPGSSIHGIFQLAFKARFSSSSYSHCQTPRPGRLMWGSELSLLWGKFCGTIIFKFVVHKHGRYGILPSWHDFALPIISLWIFLWI